MTRASTRLDESTDATHSVSDAELVRLDAWEPDESLDVRAAPYRPLPTGLWCARPVRELTDDGAARWVMAFDGIRGADLRAVKETHVAIAAALHRPELVALRLSFLVADPVLPALLGHRALVSLELGALEQRATVATLATLPSLHTLDLRQVFVPLADDVSDALVALEQVRALRYSGATDASAAWLARFVSLEALDLGETDAGARLEVEPFVAMAALPRLERLRTPSALGPDALSALAGSASLHTLDLAGATHDALHPAMREAEALAPLLAMPALREVRVRAGFHDPSLLARARPELTVLAH